MSTPKTTLIKEYFYGLGRRKTASARVRLSSGQGKITINGKIAANPSAPLVLPLKLVNFLDKYDVAAKVAGGGTRSREDAVRLGIARALVKINPEFKKTLRLEGLLTRDPRAKERKKPGLKRARKAPQWQKR